MGTFILSTALIMAVNSTPCATLGFMTLGSLPTTTLPEHFGPIITWRIGMGITKDTTMGGIMDGWELWTGMVCLCKTGTSDIASQAE